MYNRELHRVVNTTSVKQTKEQIAKRVLSRTGKKNKVPCWRKFVFTADQDSMIVDLYLNKKLGTREIAKELEIGRAPIKRRLHELNVRMRTTAETKRGTKQSQETKNKRRDTFLNKFGGYPWNMVPRSKEVLASMSRKAIERLSTTHQYNQGKYFSVKLDQEIFYRSSYELKYMKELDLNPNVLRWEYEPKEYVISYEFEGSRLYKPDFLVVYIDGTRSLVEIKGAHLMKSGKTQAKVKALEEYQKNPSNDISQCEVLVGKGRKMDLVNKIIFNN
jgi:hypothetical protein